MRLPLFHGPRPEPEWTERPPRLFHGMLTPQGARVLMGDGTHMRALPQRGPFESLEFGWGYEGEATFDLAYSLLYELDRKPPDPAEAGWMSYGLLELLPVGGFELGADVIQAWRQEHPMPIERHA